MSVDERIGWSGAAFLAVLSLLVRSFNLGTFSLWLDEILLLERARGGVRQAWQACAANAEHPPLSALAASVITLLGGGENAQRVLVIVAASAGIVLLSAWTSRLFGRQIGFVLGLILVFSPLHLRYSQEIRPYAWLLFFIPVTLLCFERVIEKPSLGRGLALAAASVGGVYTHYLFFIVTVPLVVRVVPFVLSPMPEARARGRRALGWLAAAAVAAAAALVPWFAAFETLARRPAAGGASIWDAASLARRAQVLTVGVWEGEPISWAAAAIILAAAAGALFTLRSPEGWTVTAAAVAGFVFPEFALRVANHWSHPRYDLAGWLFLMILAALGLARTGRTVGVRWATFALVGLVILGESVGVASYDRHGRPHWDRVAAAIRYLRQPGETVIAENTWTAITLGHYLARGEPRAGPPVVLGADPEQLGSAWQGDRCALVVTGGLPVRRNLRETLERSATALARYPGTEDAAIWLLRSSQRGLLGVAGLSETAYDNCAGSHRLLPSELRDHREGRLPSLFSKQVRRPCEGRLEFDAATTSGALLSGWSGFEVTRTGRTFVWAIGEHAALSLSCAAPARRTLSLRLRPPAGERVQQTVSASVNGNLIGTARLEPSEQTLTTTVDSALWRAGENIISFEFSTTVRPRDTRPGSRDSRQLAAAFDWLEITAAADDDG